MPYTPPLPLQRGLHVQGIGPTFQGSVDSTRAQDYSDFWVLQRPAPGDSETIQFALSYGYLGYGDAPDNPITITGVPATEDDELTWNDWDGADGTVWLECTDIDPLGETVADQVPDVMVNADAMGGSFDPTEAPWSSDGSSCFDGDVDTSVSYQIDQTTFRFLIAKFTADEDGNLVIEMRVRGPLELKAGPVLGNAAISPGVREL